MGENVSEQKIYKKKKQHPFLMVHGSVCQICHERLSADSIFKMKELVIHAVMAIKIDAFDYRCAECKNTAFKTITYSEWTGVAGALISLTLM